MMDRSRARRIMEMHGLDVLVGTARENIAYVSGLDGVERKGSNCLERMYVVFPRDPNRETILVLPQGYLLWVLQNHLEPCALRTIGSYHYVMAGTDGLSPEERRLVDLREKSPGSPTPIDALLAALSDAGMGGRSSIGIDESRMHFGEVDRIRKALP
jgi:Xaa-Pro aminopeptidase